MSSGSMRRHRRSSATSVVEGRTATASNTGDTGGTGGKPCVHCVLGGEHIRQHTTIMNRLRDYFGDPPEPEERYDDYFVIGTVRCSYADRRPWEEDD